MPINQLYHPWMQQICELWPDQRITQVRGFVWLIAGIYKSRSVYLSRIAGKIPGSAKLLSITRRLSRFLDNPAICVREWYEPMARDMKPVLQPKGVLFAENADGKPIGFAITLPDVNSLLKGLNGHLFPFGFIKLFRGIPRPRS